MGGLGNQLFQYAAGRALAAERETSLKLDVSGFERYPLRSYRLHHFSVAATLADGADVARVRGNLDWRPYRVLRRMVEQRRPYYRRRLVHEAHFHYDPNIRKVGRDAFLIGFWQSEKYFAGIREILLSELEVVTPPDGPNRELLGEIDATDSISLHIRRGDYVSDPRNRSFYAACTPDYYERALQAMLRRVTRPHVFVFSDDPEWAHAHLRVPCAVTFIRHNGPERDHEDLRLMSRCRHHITANSTFSWWGAWLSTHPERHVISPRAWFNDTSVNGSDIVPASWERL
jgi:hypothetical protein